MLVESECGVFSAQDEPIYGCTDSEALNFNPEATVDDGTCIYSEPEYFVVDLDNTGESSLVIIESANLSEGDEVGLFDMMGVVESCDPASGCEDIIIGEVLVGSGVWDGEQLAITSVGSIDLSQFGGPTLNGYVDGNNIM